MLVLPSTMGRRSRKSIERAARLKRWWHARFVRNNQIIEAFTGPVPQVKCQVLIPTPSLDGRDNAAIKSGFVVIVPSPSKAILTCTRIQPVDSTITDSLYLSDELKLLQSFHRAATTRTPLKGKRNLLDQTIPAGSK